MFWQSGARPELVAISGRSEAGVREASTRYGYRSYTTDWRDMPEDDCVGVFDNVAADTAHVEPTLAAIGRGEHVVCEKPLALNASDALRLYEAVERADVKNSVCFNP
jgi:predicted dehydrogenase